MKLSTRWNWSGRCHAAMNAPTAPVLTPEIAWSFGSFDRVYFFADCGDQLLDQELREAAADVVVLEDALIAILRLIRKRRAARPDR